MTHTPESIRDLRTRLGESRKVFGERFGYTPGYIGMIERGEAPITKVFELALSTVKAPKSPPKRMTGIEFKRLREAAGLTRNDVAERLGVSYETVYSVERKERINKPVSEAMQKAMEDLSK